MPNEEDTGRYWLLLVAFSGLGVLLAHVYSLASAVLLAGEASALFYLAGRRIASERRLGVELLMSFAGGAALALGALVEGHLIYILYGGAEYVEAFVEKLAVRRISRLHDLVPRRIRVLEGGGAVEKPLETLRPGDTIYVTPKSVVPVDGVALTAGVFDTSLVTGEREPTRLEPGSTVLAGYVNISSEPVLVKATTTASESMLSILVREAEKALEKKTRVQRLLDRISTPYVVAVLLAYIVASLVFNPYNALAVVLATCPSAFVVASSFSTAYAVASAASTRMLIRGGRVLEALPHVRVVVVDKTGTVTGGLRLARVVSVNGFRGEKLLELASAAAKASTHPASQAIAGFSRRVPEWAREHPGMGVEAIVDGRRVFIGSRSFVSSKADGDYPSCGEGFVEVAVAVDGVAGGVICLEESVSPGAVEAIRELRRRGLKVVLASGDRPSKVSVIAEKLRVDEYYASQTPSDKRGLVERLRERLGPTLFAGDGVNDVEAIAAADVGIAVGGLKTVAEVADAVLPRGIIDLPLLLRLGDRFRKALLLSFTAALVAKAYALAAGLTGLIPLWLVVALGDDGSTLAATGLALLVLSGWRRARP